MKVRVSFERIRQTLIVVLLVTAMIRSGVQAQTTLALGPKVGASFSGFRGEDAGNISFRKGVVGGLFVAISPVPFFTIQPELLLQQKGAVNENDNFNFKEDVKLGYLNFPVLLKLRLPLADNSLFPHIYAGPQFSYKLKSEYAVSSLDTVNVFRDLDLRSYDLGGVFGFGLDVELNHLFITADFRYALGAVNLSDESLLKNKDISIMAGIGYKF